MFCALSWLLSLPHSQKQLVGFLLGMKSRSCYNRPRTATPTPMLTLTTPLECLIWICLGIGIGIGIGVGIGMRSSLRKTKGNAHWKWAGPRRALFVKTDTSGDCLPQLLIEAAERGVQSGGAGQGAAFIHYANLRQAKSRGRESERGSAKNHWGKLAPFICMSWAKGGKLGYTECRGWNLQLA